MTTSYLRSRENDKNSKHRERSEDYLGLVSPKLKKFRETTMEMLSCDSVRHYPRKKKKNDEKTKPVLIAAEKGTSYKTTDNQERMVERPTNIRTELPY